MKTISYLLSVFCIFSLSACDAGDSIHDKDGNSYETTVVDGQTWLTKNLSTTTFRNGDLIQQATNNDEWIQSIKNKKPCWCYYEFNEANGVTYGKIYNYYAVVDSRGLAPEGFRIPKHEDWEALKASLSCAGCGNPFPKLIPSGDANWNQEDDDESNVGTNETGFSALPGGSVYLDYDKAAFSGLGDKTGWWSISNGYPNTIHNNWTNIRSYEIRSHHGFFGSNQGDEMGYYVRCLK